MLSQVAATKKQRFTLLLLTLLFVWVNGIVAPYQCIQNANAKSEIITSAVETTETSFNDFQTVPGQTSLQMPAEDGINHLHSAYPAEETFKEQEEVNHKDEECLRYFPLPDYLQLLLNNRHNTLLALPQYEHFSAVRNQSTYLLDCSFLI
jgi:hypothetical protein